MPKFLRNILIIISYIFVAAFTFIITSKLPVPKLQDFLSVYLVYLLELNFLLLVAAVMYNLKYIREIFAGIESGYVVLLIFIAIAGTCMTSFVAPRVHRIYFDEDIYNNIGQSIAEQRRVLMCNEGYYESNRLEIIGGEYNKQPAGYPYLVSVVFRIFGVNETYIFILNNIIFGFTVIVVFLIAYLLFEDALAGIFASLSYILIPVNLHWFNTCAVEPSTAFFVGLTVLSSLIYVRNRKPASLFLLTTVLAFSLNFRLETFLIVGVVGIIFLLKDMKIFVGKELYICGVLLFLLLTGVIIHFYAVRGQSWGASGPKFSLEYFSDNFKANSMFFLNNHSFPLLFSIFGVIGLFFYRSWSSIKERLIVLSWFFASWGIFLFFYAGSYNFGQDIRFSILSCIPVSIFIGLGVAVVSKFLQTKISSARLIVTVLILFNFTGFLPFIRAEGDEAWASRMGHKYAVEFAGLLPDNSIVFTHNPNIFLLRKKSAIQSSSETYNPGIVEQRLERFRGGVYVHYNYWSNVNDPSQRSFTENIFNRYNCEVVREYYYRNFKYGLYKVTGRKENR